MQRSRRVLEFIEDIIEEIEKSETGRTTGLGILEIYIIHVWSKNIKVVGFVRECF